MYIVLWKLKKDYTIDVACLQQHSHIWDCLYCISRRYYYLHTCAWLKKVSLCEKHEWVNTFAAHVCMLHVQNGITLFNYIWSTSDKPFLGVSLWFVSTMNCMYECFNLTEPFSILYIHFCIICKNSVLYCCLHGMVYLQREHDCWVVASFFPTYIFSPVSSLNL